MHISYKSDVRPEIDEIIALYKDSGLNRPVDDTPRMNQMYAQSNLVVTAWDGNKLVGIARSLTDFCYSCYLSDLAVAMDYQKIGIGKHLVEKTKEVVGDQSMLLLLSAPTAMEYYPKIGLNKIENAFFIQRKK